MTIIFRRGDMRCIHAAGIARFGCAAMTMGGAARFEEARARAIAERTKWIFARPNPAKETGCTAFSRSSDARESLSERNSVDHSRRVAISDNAVAVRRPAS